MNIAYRGPRGPLHPLIDSTGIKNGNGTPASMAASSGVSGAKTTSASTKPRWRSASRRSPRATSAMRRGDDGDQPIILTEAVVPQRIENLPRRCLGRSTCRLGHFAQIGAGLVKDVDHGAVAVVAAFEHRRWPPAPSPSWPLRATGRVLPRNATPGAGLSPSRNWPNGSTRSTLPSV